MANITIRNLDDGVVKRLKQQAKRHNRSLEAELREVLTAIANGSNGGTSSSVDLVTLARRISAMTPNVPQSDSTELLREDRQR